MTTEAQQHVADWMLKNNASGHELATRIECSRDYVYAFLRSDRCNLAPIRKLHPIVKFPPEVLADAERAFHESYADGGRRRCKGSDPIPCQLVHWPVPGAVT